MRGTGLFLTILLLIVIIGGGGFLLTWDIPPPTHTVEKVIAHDGSEN